MCHRTYRKSRRFFLLPKPSLLSSQHSELRCPSPQPSSLRTRVCLALARGSAGSCFRCSHSFPVRIHNISLPFLHFALTSPDNWGLLSSSQKGGLQLSLYLAVKTALGDHSALCHLLGMSANGHQVTLTLRTECSLGPDNYW